MRKEQRIRDNKDDECGVIAWQHATADSGDRKVVVAPSGVRERPDVARLCH